MPVAGRTFATAVLRPLAEQLAGVAAVGAGERVLELSAGDGELTARLLSAPSAPALTVVVADEQSANRLPSALGPARAGDAPGPAHAGDALGPAAVEAVIAPARQLPFADNTFDLAVSLLAIESRDQLTAALTELARVARRARVVLWTDGATHETALRDAWRDVRRNVATDENVMRDAGQDQSLGDAANVTVVPTPLPPGWTQSTLADVARFDGITQLWLALITERGIEVPPTQERHLRARLEHHVLQYTAADGTMRIPVRATLLTLQ